jgi:hypothetical protein
MSPVRALLTARPFPPSIFSIDSELTVVFDADLVGLSPEFFAHYCRP